MLTSNVTDLNLRDMLHLIGNLETLAAISGKILWWELKTILGENHYSGFSQWFPLLLKASWVDIATVETDLVSQAANRQCLLSASSGISPQRPRPPSWTVTLPSSHSSNREVNYVLEDPYIKNYPFSAHIHLYCPWLFSSVREQIVAGVWKTEKYPEAYSSRWFDSSLSPFEPTLSWAYLLFS